MKLTIKTPDGLEIHIDDDGSPRSASNVEKVYEHLVLPYLRSMLGPDTFRSAMEDDAFIQAVRDARDLEVAPNG